MKKKQFEDKYEEYYNQSRSSEFWGYKNIPDKPANPKEKLRKRVWTPEDQVLEDILWAS